MSTYRIADPTALQRAAIERAQRRLIAARQRRDAFTFNLPSEVAAVAEAERQLHDAQHPNERDTMTLIVDDAPITYTLDHLEGLAEFMVQTLQPTEERAAAARIALLFSGADHAWQGYDAESDQFFAIGSYPIDQLPA